MSRVWDESLNPYEVLELKNGLEATDADIKKAYRQLARQKHPDKNPNANVEEFHLIQTAYEILCDVEAKAAYDQLLRARSIHEARFSQQSEKRRKMREDLEAKEQTMKQERQTELAAQKKLHEELGRLRRKLEQQQEIRDSTVNPRTPDLTHILRVKWTLSRNEPIPEEADVHQKFAKWVTVKNTVLRVKGRRCSAVLELSDRSEVTRLITLQHAQIEGNYTDGYDPDLVKYKLIGAAESTHSVWPKITEEVPFSTGNKESSKLTFDISEAEVLSKLRTKRTRRRNDKVQEEEAKSID